MKKNECTLQARVASFKTLSVRNQMLNVILCTRIFENENLAVCRNSSESWSVRQYQR